MFSVESEAEGFRVTVKCFDCGRIITDHRQANVVHTSDTTAVAVHKKCDMKADRVGFYEFRHAIVRGLIAVGFTPDDIDRLAEEFEEAYANAQGDDE